MTLSDDNPVPFSSGSTEGSTGRRGGLWLGATLVLGISLWAQLFWYPLSVELQTSSPGDAYLAAYLGPLLVVMAAAIVDRPAVSLFAVPSSFIPGLVMLPRQDIEALGEFPSSVFVAATFLIYIGVAGYTVRRSSEPADLGGRGDRERVDGTYPGFVAVRVAILAGLFVAMTWTTLFDANTTQLFEATFGEHRPAAVGLTLVVSFFAWCVAAYAMFFRPLSNLEYEVREVERGEGVLPDRPRGAWRRLILWVAVAVVGVILLFWESHAFAYL